MKALGKWTALACAVALGCADNGGSGAGTASNGGNGTDNVTDPVGGNGGNGGGGANGGSAGNGGDDGGAENGGGSEGGNGAPPLSGECGGKAKANVAGPAPKFTRQEVSTIPGSAYMRPADLDADGFPEMLLTSLAVGPDIFGAIPGLGGSPLKDGAAYVLKREGGAPMGTLGTWKTTEVFGESAKVSWPNESEHFDVDGDGIGDWMIGAGFLLKPAASIVWMKGAANGTFGRPNFVPIPDKACWYHSTLPVDMDGDGDNDFVTSCHVGTTQNVAGPSRMEWYENDGKGTFTLHEIGDGGGAIIHLRDLDEDGDQDIIAPQYFGPESIVWFEQTGEKGTAWKKHLINNTTGAGFIARFADMNGDGRIDMVYGNHNNQKDAPPKDVMGIYWFEIPGKDEIRTLESWDAGMHTVYEGFDVPGAAGQAGAPGMLNVGDIDGDCDIDITASGDGDRGLYLFVQQDGKFDKVDLFVDNSNENSGEQHMLDLDGDGDLDILWAVFGPGGPGAALGLDSHIYAFLQN
jgi:hypothetical protein